LFVGDAIACFMPPPVKSRINLAGDGQSAGLNDPESGGLGQFWQHFFDKLEGLCLKVFHRSSVKYEESQ
jgi:hypothetical protein